MRVLTEDRRYDNVLLGQSYRTPCGAVIDGYGAVMEWWLAGENRRTWRRACTNATSSMTNATWNHPELNLGLRVEKPASSRLGSFVQSRHCRVQAWYTVHGYDCFVHRSLEAAARCCNILLPAYLSTAECGRVSRLGILDHSPIQLCHQAPVRASFFSSFVDVSFYCACPRCETKQFLDMCMCRNENKVRGITSTNVAVKWAWLLVVS
jgi:hypothetical protein